MLDVVLLLKVLVDNRLSQEYPSAAKFIDRDVYLHDSG